MIFPYQFKRMCFISYRVFFRRHNPSGWINGHPMFFLDGFIVVLKGVILEGFFQSPCHMPCLLLISMLVSWWRD